MRKVLSAVACLFLSAGLSFADTTLDQYTAIVVAPGAPAIVKTAAADLQYHVQKIAGRDIPIVEPGKQKEGQAFFVGSGSLPAEDATIKQLPPEGWIIKSVDNGLLLGGYEPKLVSSGYHAVSIFLEDHCGVRWVWPGESGEIIPSNPKLNIPTLNASGAPKLKRRGFTYGYARYWSPETKAGLATWMKRIRLGDQLNGSFGHAWGALIPGKEYFEKHPEFFGQVDGKRVPLQLCTSNPQLRDEFTRRLLTLPANQKFDIVAVSASDGYGFCECDACKAKGTVGDAYWDFIADVAQRVQKQAPGKILGSFAYTQSRQAPSKIDKLPSNIYLSMTAYSAQLKTDEGRSDYAKFLAEWQSKGISLILREYWGMWYWMDLPIVMTKEIADEIKMTLQAGMIGAYGETGKNWSTQAPNTYLLSHLLWNPDADPQAILADFYGTFGPAEKPIRAYFEGLEAATTKAWRDYKLTGGFGVLISKYDDMFNQDVLAKAQANIDEALKLAGNDPKLKQRVEFIASGLEYTKLMVELFTLYEKLGRSGFPLEGFEWTATAAPRRQATKSVNTNDAREIYEAMHAEPFTFTLVEKDGWLIKAWELGQKRIELLNKHRGDFNFDEGLLAHTYESHYGSIKGIRQWHQTVGRALGKEDADIVKLEYTPPVKKTASAGH